MNVNVTEFIEPHVHLPLCCGHCLPLEVKNYPTYLLPKDQSPCKGEAERTLGLTTHSFAIPLLSAENSTVSSRFLDKKKIGV